MHTLRKTRTATRTTLSALLAALAMLAAGCEVIGSPSSNPSSTAVPAVGVPSPQPDHGPPGNTPQPPVDPNVVQIAHLTVRAYAHAGGPEIVIPFDFVGTATKADGSLAPYKDEVTGQLVYLPHTLPFRETPWRYENKMEVGVVLTELQIEALAVPPGVVIICTVTDETGTIVIDRQIVTQSDTTGLRDLTLRCHHYPAV